MHLPIIYCENSKTEKIEIYLIYVFSEKKRQPNLKELLKKEFDEQKKKKNIFMIWSLTPFKSILMMHS